MYTPKHFEEKDKVKLVEFMKEYNFGTLVNSAKKKYWATHLPFLVEESNGMIILKAHMAKANPQWANFKPDEDVLVIFQEPHAYISPGLYEDPVSVPTWNYIAVHAYGTPQILPSIEEKISLLEASFEVFESAYSEQWETLPDNYRNELLNGIVAFSIKVKDIEGKFKLSQNRTEVDRENIIRTLGAKSDKVKSDIAGFMQKREK
ncbi:MAG TPA: FMN-binding negative transcriptional regulator [Ignavibacteria bacterium]|nr:FMN-binding negative transcriptional regulator [Bacteroidota bacterium]HRE10492.1 FMN-binding negative transcriptional regulator [Ignavibacteria bacterium]HRF65154.1 FMN-binding negative transcriptional regulator [Ignavibacteria bacterium]HRJ03984.1 FMN-binding negative transcriptional regulator [Ignavibacteria bacterium]HRJ85232.1 FMN-binding negative transcriptional regulator [Ignavibacteria bacterium]